MAYQFPPDVEERVQEQMASGRYGSADDVLRDALDALKRDDEDVAAEQEAIADWRAGDEGVTLDEAFAALRARHGLDEE
ncbi:MAG: type II toxin-antitoxin system ParD family antitoxin [Planctomycetes bacterium]|nr:type II toxin-antitoxin system ParD family antitoxin [Planctomycetota bacterium]